MKASKKILLIIAISLFCAEIASGATWVTKKLSNSKGDSENPAIAVSGSNLYVVWRDNTPEKYGIYFVRSGNGGKTWKAPQRLTKDTLIFKNPDIAVSGSTIYVVWSDCTSWKFEIEIYFLKSTDGGTTWLSPKRLTKNSGDSYDPKIAVDGSNLYVVWSDNTPGNGEIYFMRSINGGASWKAPQRLTNDKGSSGSGAPEIIAEGSNLYLVYNNENSSDGLEVYFLKSVDGGKTWRAAQRLTNQQGRSTYPRIAVHEQNLYVVWLEGGDLSWDMFFLGSTNGGTTWEESPRNLTNFHGILHPPSIAVEGSNLYVVWQDITPGNYEIYFMRSTN